MITSIQTTPSFPKAGDSITIKASFVNTGGAAKFMAKIWVNNEVMVNNIIRNIPSNGVWEETVAYIMPNNIINITVEEYYWNTFVSRWLSAGSTSTTRDPSITSPCQPSWVCEEPFDGYEIDGCGNRRNNNECSPFEGGISISSSPTGARVYLDGIDQYVTTPAILTLVHPGSHVVKLTLAGYQDATQTVTVIAGQTTPVGFDLSTTGSISISSSPPGAKVYLDGIDKAVTTPAILTGISPGSHVIKLTLEGYQYATQTVTVAAGQVTPAGFALTPFATTGSISISSSPPGAKVYLDGINKVVTTPAILTGISTGSHVVKLTLAGYQDATRTITVTAGQTTPVGFVLILVCSPFWQCEPGQTGWEIDGCGNRRMNPSCNPLQIGNISFVTTPPGAEIFIDGTDQGVKTPNTLTNMPAGSHTYAMKLAGYNDYTGTVQVPAGQTAQVSATLTPVSPPCTPKWQCEPGQTGLEVDGCGNKRQNPACAAVPTAKPASKSGLYLAIGTTAFIGAVGFVAMTREK